ncbi:gibberellin-regulated protein 14-like [Pyrus ussuriensis x Pyrus communis]|uniref:Gibberellin-regulated protein 14-like n=1 Tax=Pyrus ussuriensis x Pyrus communis TaxID=2448454 RepID=A0A5N5HAW6_9ROSA|nr:gibberellin-regulated protein 14-like [Pyrus ussuriensis x Pyrus communis]
MDFKAVILLFASILLLTTKVSSNDDHELKIKNQSERRSLLNIWIYPRIPFWSPAFRDPYQPQRPLYKPKAPVVLEAPPPTSDATPPPSATTSSDCFKLCDVRCKIEKNKKICRKSCMLCCARCKCVPPGDYGTNMDKCGKCYSTDIQYHGHKCP